jgi:uncharacterized membrane protein
MAGLWELIVAVVAFVGTHFLMSHGLRPTLMRALGGKGFQAVYSLVAIVTLSLAVLAFGRAPREPLLWDGHSAVAWTLASVLTFVAMALLLASFVGNPALPGARVAGLSAIMPKGVYRITRHPMMFAIAIWAVAHVIVAPSPRGLVLMGGMITLAIGGSHLQDLKKDRQHGRDWRAWMRRTSFWPDLSMLGKLGGYWALALLPWLFVTWLRAAGL